MLKPGSSRAGHILATPTTEQTRLVPINYDSCISGSSSDADALAKATGSRVRQVARQAHNWKTERGFQEPTSWSHRKL